MIKGIIALFKTGIIFNPFVFFGVVLGFYTVLSSHQETMILLFKQLNFYLLILLLAFLYHYLLKKVYKEDGNTLDYVRMIFNIFCSLFKFIISCVLSIIFMMMFAIF